MSIRQRQPTRIKAAPQGERKWEHEVTDTLNTLPQQSAFSYDTPEGNVPATPGTWGSNIKDGGTAMWVKASGDTETGWQSIATTGVYDVVSNLSSRIANRADVQIYMTASAVEFTADDGNSGNTAEITYWADGEFIQIEEKAATPGFTTTITFSNITITPHELVYAVRYSGGHSVNADLWDFDNEVYRTLGAVSSGATGSRLIAIIDPDRFISQGNAQLRFNHPDNGNASNFFRIEYVALHAEAIFI
jgi:hypothetical protein